jgi:hypothetical protein
MVQVGSQKYRMMVFFNLLSYLACSQNFTKSATLANLKISKRNIEIWAAVIPGLLTG